MTRSFRIPKPRENAKRRLFVFHHAGGSASSYSRWASLAPDTHEVVLLELPGRGTRSSEAPLTDFKSVIDLLESEISPLLNKPHLFFGHSLGALIAFELARCLSVRAEPSKLEKIGISSVLPPTKENLKRRDPISHLPTVQFMQRVEAYAPLPDLVKSDQNAFHYFLKIIRADIQIMESYEASEFENTGLPLSLFAGSRDHSVSAERLLAWSELGRLVEPLQVRSGDHFHVFNEPDALLRDFCMA